MKRIFLAAIAALCISLPAFATDVAPINLPGVVLFSGTSPAVAGTVLGPQLGGLGIQTLDRMSFCTINARIAGATGGTLDVFIQSSNNGGAAGSWSDAVHFTQLAAAGAAVAWQVTLAHGVGAAAPVAVNTADGTPVLAANTVIPTNLGNNLRVVFVAGAGTSAGATQTITAYCASL